MSGDAIGALSKRARRELGMSDRIVALIRTWVPVAVGAAATWVAKHLGLELDSVGLTAVAVAGATSLYYFLVSSIERHWPAFGVLLGVPRAPSYRSSTPQFATGAPIDHPSPLGAEQVKDLLPLLPPGTQLYVAPSNARRAKAVYTLTVDEHGVHVQENPEAS